MHSGQMIVIAFALFGFIFLALCLGSGIMFLTKSWRLPTGRAIREGDRIWARMLWSDERGDMVKHRTFIVWSLQESYGDKSTDHSVTLVGDESEDYKTQEKLGTPPKRLSRKI